MELFTPKTLWRFWIISGATVVNWSGDGHKLDVTCGSEVHRVIIMNIWAQTASSPSDPS
jgi:hypothetical protein